ncbi:PD40 domain-containing protein, partial [candidate division KSB1 bacterium]|nr:PD40 domain-containing protein [candidate division KSB1 bacterium]
LTDTGNATDPDWSPDGTRIVYVEEQGGVSNLCTIDPDGGDRRPLTRFAGDVQMLAPRWSPDGSRVAVSLFDCRGNRDVAVVDSNGNVQTFVNDIDDDRYPAWSPTGDHLVFTSYRSGSPNLFCLSAEQPDSVLALTDLAGGISRPVWRGDSLYAVLQDNRRRDRLVRLGADRRTQIRSVDVDSFYTAWMNKRPPAGLPPLSAHAFAPISVVDRGAYRAWRQVRHLLTVPVPVAVDGHPGLFVMSVFAEPLGKHGFSAAALVDATAIDNSQILGTYVNRTTSADISLSAFRLPASGQIWYDRLMVEEARGLRLDVRQTVAAGDRPFARLVLGTHIDWRRNRILNTDDLDRTVIAPQENKVGEIGLFFRYKKERPDKRALLHPLHGQGVQGMIRLSDRTWGSDLFYRRLTVEAYAILPSLAAGQTLFLRAKADGVRGETLAQDFVGLDRSDQPDFGGGLRFVERERVRGSRLYRFGDRLLFASAEYRLPLLPDLGWNLAGFAFREMTAAVFFDAAAVRQSGVCAQTWTTDRSAGVEAKNRVSVGGFEFVQAFGAAWRLPYREKAELYYRIRAAVPF